jgi:hypothetical protein
VGTRPDPDQGLGRSRPGTRPILTRDSADPDNDRPALAESLAEAARSPEETVCAVAQTLVDILPDDDPEGRLLDNFLKGRDVLPPAEVARQERLF